MKYCFIDDRLQFHANGGGARKTILLGAAARVATRKDSHSGRVKFLSNSFFYPRDVPFLKKCGILVGNLNLKIVIVHFFIK